MAAQRWLHTITMASILGAVACGGGEKAPAPASGAAPAAAGSDLTPWQLANGIGPVTEPLERLVLEGGGLDEIAREIAAAVGGSSVVLDRRGERCAS